MGDLRATSFRVQNFRNVDDSGWIELDRVTAFVGRNESGKSSLLQALHKFNPASKLTYKAQREFPRDRFQREYTDDNAKTIPVCSVRFAIEGELRKKIDELTDTTGKPESIEYTRYYAGNLTFSLHPSVGSQPIRTEDVERALTALAAGARRIDAEGDNAANVEEIRGQMLAWVATKKKSLPAGNLRTEEGQAAMKGLLEEVEEFSQPATADIVEKFSQIVEPLSLDAAKPPLDKQIERLCFEQLPVFIYFENYGILDSAVHLSRFIEDATKSPDDPRVRTISAMFQHVKLSAKDIAKLGEDAVGNIKRQGREPTPTELRADQDAKELRAIRLNAASNDITERFSKWWKQRRHHIVYGADADFFRIWVSDDRRPDVNIELEARSKGFQWFFSFYLVFLVESEEEHRDAVLLLDEPGLHLHMTAQAELLDFFEVLSEKNQLLYTTHLSSLIDGRRLTRIRAVRETANGRSEVTTGIFPSDRETYMPVQAALGYDLIQTMFQGRRGAVLEGAADMLHISAMDLLLRANQRDGLPADVMLIPSEGTKFIGVLASIYIGQGVRPVVLLDDDDAGRTKAAALTKELYRGEEDSILFVSQAVSGCFEIEDVVGEPLIVKMVSEVLGIAVKLTAGDRSSQSGVVDAITAWSKRTSTALPPGWKFDVAYRILKARVAGDTAADLAELDRAQALLVELDKRARR